MRHEIIKKDYATVKWVNVVTVTDTQMWSSFLVAKTVTVSILTTDFLGKIIFLGLPCKRSFALNNGEGFQ